MGESPTTDSVEAFLDARLQPTPSNTRSGAVGRVSTYADGEPVETPTPEGTPGEVSPSPSATPSPTPSPLAVQDTDLIALVQQVHAEQLAEQQGSRAASTGIFLGQCVLIMLAVAAILFMALKRR